MVATTSERRHERKVPHAQDARKSAVIVLRD